MIYYQDKRYEFNIKSDLFKQILYSSNDVFFDVDTEQLYYSKVYNKKIDNLDIVVYRNELSYCKSVLNDIKPCEYYKRKFLIFKEKYINYPLNEDLMIVHKGPKYKQWVSENPKEAILWADSKWLYLMNYNNITYRCFDIII